MEQDTWLRFAGPFGFALAALVLDLRLMVYPSVPHTRFMLLADAMYGLSMVSICWGFVLETIDMRARHRRERAAMTARHAREIAAIEAEHAQVRAVLARWREQVTKEEP